MNFVPCLTWVKRGVAKHIPDQVQFTQEELKKMAIDSAEEYKSAKSKSLQPDSKHEERDPEVNSVDDEMGSFNANEYNLDSYDDEREGRNAEGSSCAPLLKPEDLDVTFGDSYNPATDDEWEDEEKEDFIIKENDNLLVVGHIENESSTLEIYVYNEEEGDLYIHHDIILPAYPVSLEWLSYGTSGRSEGNYIAVGDMTPVINIWDLDVVNILEPVSTLGRGSETENCTDIHSDSILALGWNKDSRNILASGSADEKICLWDLENLKPSTTLNLQKGKVQTLQWHPQESQYLLCGTTNGCVFLGDCRTPVDSFTSFSVNGEVEKVLWNHFDPYCFLCSTDEGYVYCMDVRTNNELYSFQAHTGPVMGLLLNQECPGCLITSSLKMVKVWDILDKPVFVSATKLKIGSVFAASFCPDSSFILACGGNRASNNMVIKNILELPNCGDVFGKRPLQKCS